jgi:hypothetical protein
MLLFFSIVPADGRNARIMCRLNSREQDETAIWISSLQRTTNDDGVHNCSCTYYGVIEPLERNKNILLRLTVYFC